MGYNINSKWNLISLDYIVEWWIIWLVYIDGNRNKRKFWDWLKVMKEWVI